MHNCFKHCGGIRISINQTDLSVRQPYDGRVIFKNTSVENTRVYYYVPTITLPVWYNPPAHVSHNDWACTVINNNRQFVRCIDEEKIFKNYKIF